MTLPAEPLFSSTRHPSAELARLIQGLQPGQEIEIIQQVRVGSKVWNTTVQGKFRCVNYLATGLATDRVPEDDIIVPTVHFIKNNQELSSISLDENTQIRLVGG